DRFGVLQKRCPPAFEWLRAGRSVLEAGESFFRCKQPRMLLLQMQEKVLGRRQRVGSRRQARWNTKPERGQATKFPALSSLAHRTALRPGNGLNSRIIWHFGARRVHLSPTTQTLALPRAINISHADGSPEDQAKLCATFAVQEPVRRNALPTGTVPMLPDITPSLAELCRSSSRARVG